MGAGHSEFGVTIVEKASTKRTDVDAEIITASPSLNRNLPQAD
jgi:hypothetical protein